MRNTDMMNEYIEYIKNIKRLTAEEEFELALEMRNGNKKARERFIEANMYLVIYYCKPYINFGVPYEDLFQEGTLALIKAVDNYDPTRTLRFMNFAHFSMYRFIERGIGKALGVHMTCDAQAHEVCKIIAAKNKIEELTGIDASVDEIADSLLIHRIEVQRILSLIDEADMLDSLIDEEYDFVEECLNGIYAKEMVDSALEKLTPREQKVLRMYYGLDGNEPMRMEDIGKELGCTRKRISQIKIKSEEKILGFRKPSKRQVRAFIRSQYDN